MSHQGDDTPHHEFAEDVVKAVDEQVEEMERNRDLLTIDAHNPSLPPPLTPHTTAPQPDLHGNDILHLIHFLQVSRLQDEAKRKQEEDDRRIQEQVFRLQLK